MTAMKVTGIGLLVLALAAWWLLGMAGRPTDAVASEGDAAATPAAAGPHRVGVTDLGRVADGGPVVTAWYPAVPATVGPGVAYPYEVRIAGVLGTTTLGTSSGLAVRDAAADVAGGPRPVVVLPAGFAIGAATYGWLAEHLASHGFVVVAHAHDETLLSAMSQLWRSAVERPRTLHRVLDHVTARAAPGEPLDGLVDLDRVAVVGHSFGGYTALAAAGARLDPAGFARRCDATRPDDPGAWLCDVLVPHLDEMAALAGVDDPSGPWPDWRHPSVRAVVSLAGDAYLFDRSGLAEVDVPVLSIGGTADTDTPWDWGTGMTHAGVGSERTARLRLDGAGHMVFTARCDRVRRIADLVPNDFCRDGDGGQDRARVQALVRDVTTTFLLAELVGDPDASAVLAGDPAAHDPAADWDTTGYRP